MKRSNSIILTLFTILLLQGCACERVPQGYTGIIAHDYGSEKGGVEEVGPGRHWYNPTTKSIYIYPNFVQRKEWDGEQAVRVLSRDQLEFVVDVGLSYYVDPSPGVSKAIFIRYRKDIDALTNGYVRDAVRGSIQEVFSQFDADAIYGAQRPQVMGRIDEEVKARLSPEGFVVQALNITRLEPPQSVKEAVERKIQAAQAALTEQENLSKIRFLSQQDSIKAVMDARNNEMLARSITPELLEYEKIQLMKAKWNGQMPQVVGGGDFILDLNR